MIFGSYPCCDEPLTLSIPPNAKLPAFYSEKCPGCGTVVWHKLSRWDPTSWTEEDFLKEFTVDDETKEVIPKPKG